jgi:hypothetical protein
MKVVASKIEKFSPEIEPWTGRLIESRDAIKRGQRPGFTTLPIPVESPITRANPAGST